MYSNKIKRRFLPFVYKENTYEEYSTLKQNVHPQCTVLCTMLELPGKELRQHHQLRHILARFKVIKLQQQQQQKLYFKSPFPKYDTVMNYPNMWTRKKYDMHLYEYYELTEHGQLLLNCSLC